MRSMTGFGKGTAELDGLTVSVELKSVNHRFLDLAFKTPRTVSFLEDGLRKRLQAALSRGHVDVYMTIADTATTAGVEAQVDFAKARALTLAAKQLEAEFGLVNDFSVTSLMKSADVVTLTAAPADEGRLEELCFQALDDAIRAMLVMREREGASLKVDLSANVDAIERNLVQIAELAKGSADVFRTKLESRMREILKEVPVDEARLLNEVAVYADHVAVDEETTRLSTHIAHARELFESEEPIGKKLDFLVQEMFRETNTIGSKCNDTQITKLVLDTKNVIEKLREQIQNIE